MKYIYTCLTGGKDKLNEDINAMGAKLVCFTDKKIKSKNWEIRVLPRIFQDVRRDSRIPKMLPHIYMPDAEYSLYLDANIICKVPIQRLITEWLQETDIAVFGHSTRDCLFDEAQECIRLELDKKEVIKNQIERYKGFPKHKGLYQCGAILRKHTPKINKLGNAWWAEYCTGSRRDQISFPYVVENEGITINPIDSHAYIHPYFEYVDHVILSEWAGKV